jgi:small basic protein
MRRTMLILLPVPVLVGLIAAQPAAAADPQDQVVISGDVNVPRDRTLGDVVVVDGSVAVAGRERLGLSLAWGARLFVSVPIVAVIALVSLVGIPLGVGLLLALAPVAGLAYVTSCYVLGRTLLKDPAGRIPVPRGLGGAQGGRAHPIRRNPRLGGRHRRRRPIPASRRASRGSWITARRAMLRRTALRWIELDPGPSNLLRRCETTGGRP